MKILVSAETFGYGPIATCLNVTKELKKFKDIQLDFIGSGIALEQAKLTNHFDHFYVCDIFDNQSLEENKEIFKKYDYFLSSENINGAIFAQKYVKNVYYIDNLMWMWDQVLEPLKTVKKFFISETFPCDENFKRIGEGIKNPVFVGPIRDMSDNKITKENVKNQLVINIGGASSFLMDQEIVNTFYNKIINDILEVEEINNFDSIIICGGSKVIDNLKIKENPKIIVKTLSNEEYLKVMNESSHCIMSSGLGNFIETLNKDKNILYLPAVNYSQLLQLQYYKKMNFGFGMLNWDEFDFYKEIPLYLEESIGVDMVIDNVKSFNNGDYKDKVQECVKRYLDSDQSKYYEIRNKNYDQYDKNASYTIAKTIVDDIEKE